ncbi:unnamed protein product [marine sediment metagenome]|uniref:Uncharacterized protein n=1 Tax=marine sediment metagenome TaxID=412755 RepID=X1FFI8_9ZZZZ
MKYELNEIEDLDVALLLQKTDRILAEEEKISVENLENSTAMNSPIACASPSKSSIFLNFDKIKKVINSPDNFLILSKGLNYHELAHILFTDFSERKVKKFLYEKQDKLREKKQSIPFNGTDFFKTLNIVEDCRIENLFYLEYPRAKYYFSFCALIAEIISTFPRF